LRPERRQAQADTHDPDWHTGVLADVPAGRQGVLRLGARQQGRGRGRYGDERSHREHPGRRAAQAPNRRHAVGEEVIVAACGLAFASYRSYRSYRTYRTDNEPAETGAAMRLFILASALLGL